jgi:capsular exopolysaccharide synthesis family protein
MVAGLVLGGGLAVISDRLDQRIRAPDEAARLLGMPVLGVIPARFTRGPEDRSRIGCAVENAPTSALADAFTAMAVSLHVAWPKQDVKTLLVTSPNRGDGKSTTCSNLAIAMASAGRKTLLIDADLRRPVQHEIFGKLNAVGVSDVVAHGMFVDRAIQKTGIESLSLLACGALPPNPSEIVRGQGFTQMVEALEEQFDLIIIDSPPILAAPDARILGAQADVALLVLRSERSTRQDADQAAKTLRGVGANLVGLVFNGVAQSRSSYYYQEDDDYRSPETSARARRIEGKVVVEGESLVY